VKKFAVVIATSVVVASSLLFAESTFRTSATAAPPSGPGSTTKPRTKPRTKPVPRIRLTDQGLDSDLRSFIVDVDGDNLAALTTGQIVATLHPRVRTRDVFDANAKGLELGSVLAVATSSSLTPTEIRSGHASRRLSFDLESPSGGCPVCTSLVASGVYPVHVELRTAGAEAVLDHFTTFLVWQSSTSVVPMAVALIVPIHLPPALPDAPPADTRSVISMIETLASRPQPTLTILPTPETLDALSSPPIAESTKSNTESGPLVDELRVALSGREILSSPYVRWDPAFAADERLGLTLEHQRDLGRSVVQQRLGATTIDDIAIVGDRIPSDVALDRLGVRRLVVAEAAIVPSVRPVDPTLPFIVDPGASSGRETQARPTVLLDRRIHERLQTRDLDRRDANDVLRARQVTAELAFLALARGRQSPSGVAVLIPEGTSRTRFNNLLDGLLALPGVLRQTTLGALFTLPLQVDADGTNSFRAPTIQSPPSTAAAAQTTQFATSLLDVGSRFAGYETLFSSLDRRDPRRSGELATLDRHLARLTAEGVGRADRAAALVSLQAEVGRRIGQVGLTSAKRITLTARHQDVPVGVVNSTGEPVDVTMIIESDNIELGDGKPDPGVPARETLRRTVHIDGRVHREAIRVTTRGPGSYSMIIRLRAPNGYEFSRVRYTLRSTAIGPIGTVLTFGSLAIIALWWGRTILAKRRRTALHRHPASARKEPNA
jgi:hypothetical protein